MPNLKQLVSVMTDARRLLANPRNDFAWSSWRDVDAALAEIDRHLEALGRGVVPKELTVLFLPTGPIQEVSLSSGWGTKFLKLAERFDHALATPG